MASNHGNLYNKLLALVLGHYRVPHAEVNVPKYGGDSRTGTVTGTATERSGQCRWNNTGNGGKWKPARAGQAVEGEDEKRTLVGDLQDYWGF